MPLKFPLWLLVSLVVELSTPLAADSPTIQAIDEQKSAEADALFHKFVVERPTAAMIEYSARDQADAQVFTTTDPGTREKLLLYYTTKSKLTDFEKSFLYLSFHSYIDAGDEKGVMFILVNLYTSGNLLDNNQLVSGKLSEPIRLLKKGDFGLFGLQKGVRCW